MTNTPTPTLVPALARCLRCDGTGSVYYIAARPEVIGGKRARCADCGGAGWVAAAVAEMQHILRGAGPPSPTLPTTPPPRSGGLDRGG